MHPFAHHSCHTATSRGHARPSLVLSWEATWRIAARQTHARLHAEPLSQAEND